ncbi:MAG: hypothetical protein EYC68_20670 [Chloroflexota bacterium]|nr:MAG: hypothetical protein EYC68_20670 [Chloroflexota bacterium]
MTAPFDLPDGWTSPPLADVCKIERGITFPAIAKSAAAGKGKIACLRTTNVQAIVDWDDLIYVSDGYVKNETKILRANDILISMANSLELVGKVAFVDHLPMKSTFGGFISSIRAFDKVIPRFLFYFLRTNSAQGKMRDTASRSVNIANLSLGQIYQIPIPLPPLPEQQRIVARIETLFAESRTARDALERVSALLKRFRQSVLASAFRGELTEREPQISKVLETLEISASARVSNGDLPEVPEGWAWTTTETLAANEPYSFSDGPFGSNLKTADYTSSGVRVIRLQNIGVGEFKNDAKAFVSREKYELLRKHEAKAGDVIIAALAEPVGRACLVPEGIGTAIVKADCIRLRVNNNLADSKFVMLALNTQEHFKRAEEAAHGVGRLRANFSDIKAFGVPLAPLPEQRRIVARIEALFAQADAIERAVAIAQQRADKLDQAILARAFRGEL